MVCFLNTRLPLAMMLSALLLPLGLSRIESFIHFSAFSECCGFPYTSRTIQLSQSLVLNHNSFLSSSAWVNWRLLFTQTWPFPLPVLSTSSRQHQTSSFRDWSLGAILSSSSWPFPTPLHPVNLHAPSVSPPEDLLYPPCPLSSRCPTVLFKLPLSILQFI